MRYLFSLLLVVCFSHALFAADRWAVVIGASTYPKLEGKFPQLPHAARDAGYVADILTTKHCGFSASKVLLLRDSDATSDNVRRVIRRHLAQTKPDDMVFLFFAGHGIVEQGTSFYWLLADSEPENLPQTSLSFDELGFMLWSYVPARNIFVCSDARHSPQALGKVELTLKEALSSKNFCILESSSYEQQAEVRGGRGLFTHFFLSALRGTPYLGKTADANEDGFITASEVVYFVSWAMGLSGLDQSPMGDGTVDVALAEVAPGNTFVRVLEPRFITDEQEITINGFIRDDNGVGLVSIDGVMVDTAPISPEKANELRLASSGNTYWFEKKIAIGDKRKLTIEVVDYAGAKEQFEHPLVRLEQGWRGEWMPLGMKTAEREGVYLWQRDNTEMVYIPPGQYFLGIPRHQAEDLRVTIIQQLHYLRQNLALFKDNKMLKETLVKGLEESNEALLRIGNKLLVVDRKVKILDKVNSEASGVKEDRDFPGKDEIPDELLKSDSQQTREQTLQYFLKARSVLGRCYQDLFVLSIKQGEIADNIRYLEMLQKIRDEFELLWAPRKVETPGFYIDIYEIDNRHYLEFVNTTSRPYPADPWWQEQYLWRLPDYPVVNVSWEDANAYATWSGKQLPTAQQWEIAARGHIGYIYPWGNQPPDRRRTNADVPPSPDKLTFSVVPQLPVAVTEENQGKSMFGCLHLAGNVWEWCHDAPYYPQKVWEEPLDEYRVSKGGSFASTGFMLSAWFEHPFPLKMRRSDLGFRCIVTRPVVEEKQKTRE